MRLLVCGGRDFNDANAANLALNAFHAAHRIEVVIHGAYSGADTLADEWAKSRGIARLPFPAEWARLGPSAGPIRNAQMIREGKPDAVYAFPGHRGTADMIRRAKAAGLPVY